MSNILDASIFSFGDGFHALYLQEVMLMLSSAYQKLIEEVTYNKKYNENKLRDDLVKYIPSKREGFLFHLDTESRNLDRGNVRIDITIITLEVLCKPEKDFDQRMTIECKIIGVSEYINRNGIISYVEGKYASSLPVAGMIGFVFTGDPEEVKNKINKSLKRHRSINTTRYLEYNALENDFKNSYLSTHLRNGELPPIDLSHLLLDYSKTITKSQ